jgi:hypothetical protein
MASSSVTLDIFFFWKIWQTDIILRIVILHLFFQNFTDRRNESDHKHKRRVPGSLAIRRNKTSLFIKFLRAKVFSISKSTRVEIVYHVMFEVLTPGQFSKLLGFRKWSFFSEDLWSNQQAIYWENPRMNS